MTKPWFIPFNERPEFKSAVHPASGNSAQAKALRHQIAESDCGDCGFYESTRIRNKQNTLARNSGQTVTPKLG